jgi:branched-chain amino acid transport system substrate-binding protein
MRPVRALPLVLAVLAVVACEKKKPTEGATAGSGPAASSAAPAGDRILLGHVGSLTGQSATFGLSSDKGIQLAIEELNAKGGVKGKLLALKTYDDEGKPDQAAYVASRLVKQDKVTVLLGEVASTRSLAMAPIADSEGVPMITPSSTNPTVTKQGDKVRPYVFRVCFIDPFQGTVMAKFVRGELKLSRVAVLRDVGNDYSVGLADFFLAKFKELGGTIVTDQSYREGDPDFKAQLTAIKARNPEAIYVPGYYNDVALIARQARELGMAQPLLGGDGWDSEKLYEIGGKALQGSYFSNHYSPEDPAPRIQEFVKRYKEKFGSVPDSLAAQAYDAAKIAGDAIGRANDFSGAAIRDAIAATRDYPGVTGVITIDADHNAVKPAVVLRIEGNSAKYATTPHPNPTPAGPAAAK